MAPALDRIVPEVAAAVEKAREAFDDPCHQAGDGLGLLARRLLGGAARSAESDAAMRRWFGVRELPPGVLEAASPRLLVEAAGNLRSQAIALHDLLKGVEDDWPSRRGDPVGVWGLLDRGGGGTALRLWAWRVDGPAGLAADARLHGFAERDEAYRSAERSAARVLAARSPRAAVRYALVADDGEPFGERIGEGSLGLALAVAALEAARGRLFVEIDPGAAFTGTVASDGAVGPVDPRGLVAKGIAAQRVGTRRLVVPSGQATVLSALAGIQILETGSVAEVLRRARVVRRAVKVVAVLSAAVVALAGFGVREHRADRYDDRQRELAAVRAMAHALAIADSDPRAALGVAAGAGALEPDATEPGRALLAATLPPGVRFLPDLRARATALSWTDDRIRAATDRGLLELDVEGGRWRALHRLPRHRLAAFDGSGDRLVLGGRAGASVIDLRSGRTARLTTTPARAVAAGDETVALTRSGRVVASDGLGAPRPVAAPGRVMAIAVHGDRVGAVDGAGRLLRMRGAELVRDKDTPLEVSGRLTALSVVDGRTVAADRSGVVVDRDPDRLDSSTPTYPVASAVLALPRGRSAAVRRGWGVEILTPDGYLRLRREQRLAGRFSAVAVSPDGRRLLAAGREVAVLRLDRYLPSRIPLAHSVVFDPRGRLVTLDRFWGSVVRLRPNRSPTVLYDGRDGLEAGTPVASLNGRWAAQNRSDGKIRRWDLVTGDAIDVTPRLSDGDAIDSYSQQFAILDDGRLVVSSSSDDDYAGTTYLVPPSGRSRERYLGYGPFAIEIQGGRVALARGEAVEVLKIAGMRKTARVRVPGEYVNSLAAAENGETVFFGARSGNVWRWRPSQRGSLERIAQVDGMMVSLAARQDGRLLFGARFHGLRQPSALFGIDVERGETTKIDFPEAVSPFGLDLSANGRWLAAGGADPVGAVLVSSHLDPADACARAGRAVPQQVWRRAVGGLPVAAPQCSGDESGG